MSFPALRGYMGGRAYYVLLLPLALIPRVLYVPDGEQLPPEVRAQRKLNTKRIPEITKYILDNEDGWLFSSLTASFDEEEHFEGSVEDPSMGTLTLPLDSRLLVNDGQHRRAAIERALKVDPTLGDQMISLVLFPAESLERNQQMFSDLNRTTVRASRSVSILYDHRDPLNQITLALEHRVPLLQDRIEKESQSIAVRSAKLVTVSALYDMTREIIGDVDPETSEPEIQALEDEVVEVWLRLTDALPQWDSIVHGDLRPAEARAQYINVHAVFFYAIGGVARQLGKNLNSLSKLSEVKWSRSNPEWQGICMLGPDIVTRRQTRTALRQQILFRLGEGPRPMPVIDRN